MRPLVSRVVIAARRRRQREWRHVRIMGACWVLGLQQVVACMDQLGLRVRSLLR